MASEPPPSIQAKMCGSLICVTMKDMVASDFPKKTLQTSRSEELAYPRDKDSRKIRHNRKMRTLK